MYYYSALGRATHNGEVKGIGTLPSKIERIHSLNAGYRESEENVFKSAESKKQQKGLGFENG